MARAGAVVAAAHEEVAARLRPGMSTLDLDRIAEEVITGHGAVPSFKGYRGFPATLCTSLDHQIVHGIPLGDVGSAIEAVADEHGFGVVREYVGHGIGRALHEDPSVPNYGTAGRGSKLSVGWVIAVEPMFNLGSQRTETLEDGWTVVTADGSLSAHWEHTIAITDD
ncbi:MAG: M24 family metallopeptidase, partial [Nitriliruptor sp.]